MTDPSRNWHRVGMVALVVAVATVGVSWSLKAGPEVVEPEDQARGVAVSSNQPDLPGDDMSNELSVPAEVSVIGVNYDDVLNVRLLPDSTSDIVARLEPTATQIATTGRMRRRSSASGNSFWIEVESVDGVGWVNRNYVAAIGSPGNRADETEWFLASRANGSMPTGTTIAEVASRFAQIMSEWESSYYPDEDFGATPRSATVTDPEVNDGVVIVDIRMFGDDTEAGTRYELLITPNDSGGYTLSQLNGRSICARSICP